MFTSIRRFSWPCALTALSLGLIYCGSSSHEKTDVMTHPSMMGLAKVPQALDKIEGDAEDAYDQALANNAAVVRKDALAIEKAWKGFRDQIKRDGAPIKSISAMDNAVLDLSTKSSGQATSIQLARSANGISGQMDVLFANYSPTVPPAINRLDYLGREIQLDAMEQLFDNAQQHVTSVQQVWSNLKPTVIAAGGASAASDFETSLGTLQKVAAARNATDLAAAAIENLDLVDALENVFTHN